MSTALVAALCFTVALLVTTAYFLMGSIPLLVLKHDSPVDARFVRGFFNTYFLGALVTASATALSYAFAGRFVFALGAASLALLAGVLRRVIIRKMDSLQPRIQTDGSTAIPDFRRTHLAAIAATLAQFVLLVWSLTTISVQ